MFTGCWRHPPKASKKLKRKIPLESARAGAEDDSTLDNTVNDLGTETDMSMESTSQKTSSRSAVSKDMELQVCVCGWSKATTVRGLKIHQGRMKCLREKGQGPRIDQYFLRSQSSQSNEIQRQEANHSSQDISTPVIDVRRTCMDTVSDEPNDPCEPGQTNQHKREKNLNGHKPGVKWPRACEKTAWDTVNTDLCVALERLSGTVEKKLDKFGDIIYAYGSERFGVEKRKEKVQTIPGKSRRQQEIERLVRERRQLRNQWRRAEQSQKEGLNLLQRVIKDKLATLRRAERLRKRYKKKERARANFYKDPFKFVKKLFTSEKNGTLKASKVELERYLEETHTDSKRQEPMSIPSDIPPINPPEYQMEDCAPKWKEVEQAVKKARASSSPGPNGVPYRVYKSASGVLRILWKLMKVAWEKQVVPRAWRRAGGVFIPKEKDSTSISQFRPISLLNVEGKIFFSIIAQRLSTYLLKNCFIDTSIQKAGIPGFPGCLEHINVIWQQIQSAKKERKELHVTFLDLANAYGSVPHELLWAAFDFFSVPMTITNLVKAYFGDLQFSFSTSEFSTTWQCLEVGIMAGCTISPLAFTMAMEVIIRASKWVVGGERLASGMRLPPIRAYMDDMTTMTTTVACTNRLLGKLTNNIEWARMQFKPTKSRSISIIKGKVVDKTFFINGEAIPTVSEKPVKSLGRWYDGDLKDTVRVGEVRQQAVEGLKSIDSSALPGKLKLWCFQFGLLPRLLWPLTVYEVSLTTVEKLEALISSYIRKWLGVPRCLSRVGLYGKGILQLPVSALTEEFKCAKVRLEMTLVESRDKCVREAAPVLKTGRKWAAKKAVEDAKAALRIGDIMGQVQHGRGGLGLSSAPPTWHKAAPAQRRKLVVNEVQKQEERMRCIKAISQAKQGEWMRWESVEQRKIGWQDLWSMEQSRISFLIRSTYDVLPSPQNLNLWVGEDPSCPLCSSPATLRHILTGCKVALSQGRFTWRHDQVLRCLALALEDKRNMTNKLPPVPSKHYTQKTTFLRPGEQPPRKGVKTNPRPGQLEAARDWKMLADVGQRLIFPPEIATTNLRPDIVLWSGSARLVHLVELTVPWEDAVDEAYERKKLRYAQLATEAEQRGWRVRVYPVEVGCRGFVAHSTTRFLRDVGFSGQELRRTVKNLSEAAERSSNWLWLRRKDSGWGSQAQ